MLEIFHPNGYYKSSYHIDYEKEYEQGIRGIIFDIDNTLVEHGQDATEEAKALMKRLKEIGFKVCLISNNKKERVERFNKDINVFAIWDGHKPSRKNYLKAMELMNTNKDNTLFVGDQVFTDIFGANRTGIKSYLVGQIAKHEEIQIVIKRRIERLVLHSYLKKNKEQA